MSVALETRPEQIREHTVFAVPDMETELYVRPATARFLGRQALRGQEMSGGYDAPKSLAHALQGAADGNESDRQMVIENVKTDIVERTLKTGHVSRQTLRVNQEGDFYQHTQSYEDILSNSLTYASDLPQMRGRVVAETENYFRAKQLHADGFLNSNSMLVFSLVPDDMSVERAKETGFFTDTMSVSIQLTSLDAAENSVVVESAFVAGTKGTATERYDIQTVVELAKSLGVDLSGKSVTEILATPLLVPNSHIPNGAVDIVKQWDDVAGGTFFGTDQPRADYVEYLEVCAKRETEYQPIAEIIAAELIDEAESLTEQVAACKRLDKLAAGHMLRRAIVDRSIDPRVFGDAAVPYIQDARRHYDSGDYESMGTSASIAQSLEQSSSCPSGISKMLKDGLYSTSEGSDKFGSLKFNCPSCKKTNTRKRDTLLTSCQHCKSSKVAC